jgi:putative ABC transport system ATP-binding protein
VIELRGVTRSYPGPPEVAALGSVDFSVRRGEYLAVVGRSGSGKSTLLNILGLLDRPSQGSYLLDGIDTSRLAERERAALRGHRIGFVFQSIHLLEYRTATENVMVGQVYTATPRTSRRPTAREALARVGLGHRLDALPATLSLGERQRVAIARALVNTPSLLLCDEPTGNLDSTTAGQIVGLLADLHRDGATIIVITHDPEAAALAERTITMRDGRLDPAQGPDPRHVGTEVAGG